MALPNTNAAGIDPETMRMLIAQLLAEQGAGGPGMGQGVNTDAGLAGNPSGQWGGSAFGDFNAGAAPVRVVVEFGDVFFEDTLVTWSTGKSVKY